MLAAARALYERWDTVVWRHFEASDAVRSLMVLCVLAMCTVNTAVCANAVYVAWWALFDYERMYDQTPSVLLLSMHASATAAFAWLGAVFVAHMIERGHRALGAAPAA